MVAQVYVSALMPFGAIPIASMASSERAAMALLAVLHAIGVACGVRAFLATRAEHPALARFALIGPGITVVGWGACSWWLGSLGV